MKLPGMPMVPLKPISGFLMRCSLSSYSHGCGCDTWGTLRDIKTQLSNAGSTEERKTDCSEPGTALDVNGI